MFADNFVAPTASSPGLSEQQFHEAVERNFPVGLFRADAQGHYKYVNAYWCQLTGLSAQEAEGEGWQRALHPDDRSQNAAYWQMISQSTAQHSFPQDTFYKAEYRIQHPNGQVLWVLQQAIAQTDETGTITSFTGTITDISYYKAIEERLKNERQQAIDSLRQNQEDILKSLEKERDLGELKSRFISMVSHEFRTPLTTIQSSAELLEYYDWSEVERHERFQQIRGAVQHMTQLLEDVLLIGKADAKQLQCNPQPVNLASFCQELIADLSLFSSKHSLRFSLLGEQVIGESVTVCLDTKLLRQILSNLLSNAIKYSAEGSEVDLTVCCRGDQTVFQVIDRGIGIPRSDQEKLFEAFYRATNVTTIQGTGLGLAIVKKCVDLHRGQITFHSEIEKGTTFTVILPLETQFHDLTYV